MRILIHRSWLRYCRNVCASLVLIFVASSSWPLSMKIDPNLSAARYASFNRNNYVPYLRQRYLERWIEIDISQQKLSAWEGRRRIYVFRISTGKRRTPTPLGRFLINSKYPTHRMRGNDYDLPDVPYTMYFSGSYAIHGAYWHNRFGTRVSHGCVNLRVRQARQLYNWSRVGTLVVIHR